MNNKLSALTQAVAEATAKLEEAEAERDAFLGPILKALGTARGGGVSYCSVGEEGTLHVTLSGSCRGCGWSESYRFPLGIFTAEDPLKAAADYVAEQKRVRDTRERIAKQAQIERLQRELARKEAPDVEAKGD